MSDSFKFTGRDTINVMVQMKLQHHYIKYRRYLLAVAYNMLGQIHEAEDVVQDLFVDLVEQPLQKINNVKTYITRIVINKCIDRLKVLKRERSEYPGIWLPEPVITETPEDANTDILKYAFMHMLEVLNPIERSVLILREAFHLPYHEIAEICNISEVYCRQLLRRARLRLKVNPPLMKGKSESEHALLDAFIRASVTKDMHTLVQLLANDIRVYSDGGGKVTAARNVIEGAEHVIRFMVGITGKSTEHWLNYSLVFVNGEPALKLDAFDKVYMIMALKIENKKIYEIFVIRNPEKIFLDTCHKMWATQTL